MSRSVAQARQNHCLALSRSVFALKMNLWPASGSNLPRSGPKFSYGQTKRSHVLYFASKIKRVITLMWLTSTFYPSTGATRLFASVKSLLLRKSQTLPRIPRGLASLDENMKKHASSFFGFSHGKPSTWQILCPALQ